MINIGNIKIDAQLKISFGIILMFILILGGISWIQSNKIAQQTYDLYEHPLKVRRALSKLKIDVLSLDLEYSNILLKNDEKNRQELLKETALFNEDARQSIDLLYSQYLGPKSDVERVNTDFINLNSALNSFNSQLTGKTKEELIALNISSELEKQTQKILESIQVIDKFAINKADQLFASSIELKKSIDLQLLFFIIIILVLTFVINTILMRNINKPLNELIKATKMFGKGKLETRSQYVSSNEFGELSGSFNNLADTIEKDFAFKDQTAKLNAIMLKALETNAPMKRVLEPLMKLTHSQVGVVYLLNQEKTDFEVSESIGMESVSGKSFSASNFEGELGIALASKKIEHIKQIQTETLFSLKAASGHFRPREIITIPLSHKQEVVAMISLSSLQEYDKQVLRHVTDMQTPITTWMNAMIAKREIQKLDKNLKSQNIELEAQKKELASQAGELLEQNAELEMQKKQLHESNQLKSNFLSNMSHELRTPLNSVIALSGVLNRRLATRIPEEEYSYLSVIERNGKLLLSLINDILDLSRIEAGFEELQLNRFNINSLVREVIDLIESQAIQKDIGLSFEADEELPSIRSDYEKCRHILQNIIANAIKFTDSGKVVIRTKSDNRFAHIEIIDTGIGIDNEFLAQIFDEFRQADNSNSRKHGGTGLGLAIANKYAALLGGSIKVESEIGKGSKFTLILPLYSDQYEQEKDEYKTISAADKASAVHKWDFATRGGKEILIVEDSEAAIIQMKEMLTSEGFNITVAQNGKEALEQIAHKIPDAMILDLMMPEVDGFEVLKKIREKEETSKLPVLILTAKFVTKEELKFLKHNHVHQLIQKGDINKTQLLTALSVMISSGIPQVPEQIKRTAPPPNTNNSVILVIEDNPDNMLTIKALLNSNYKIIEAYDGLKGIELAKENRPNLILMDIALPEMNGIEVLNELRKIDYLDSVRIIAVSASAMKGDREHFIACGFDDYISKPIDNKIFDQIITKELGIISRMS
jgi:signal transduction histidine kinase/DNA-binding response OmpR family regulator/HAMP domain-containing protein